MIESKSTTVRSAGERDPTFADKGIYIFPEAFYLFRISKIGGVMPTKNGKILVAASKINKDGTLEQYVLARLNEDGTPDKRFGTNGSVIGHFAAAIISVGISVSVTHEGKIILSGYHIKTPLSPRRPSLAQHLSTGELDESFGEKGIVHLDFLIPESVTSNGDDTESPENLPPASSQNYSVSITPLPDGKLIFCGMVEPTRDSWTTRLSMLGRLNPDGTLDKSFASEGYFTLVGNPNTAIGHVVQPDGKILVCGQIDKGSHTTIYVRRYLENGTPDPTFAFSERPLEPGILDGGLMTAIALHEDGRIIIGANKLYTDGGATKNGVLMCLTSNGAWDSRFNGGKPVEMKLGTSSFRCMLKDILIDGDGIILMGDMGNTALARYSLDGTPDAGFGDRQGWWQYPSTESNDLARQHDGKILATGMSTMSADYQKFVARFLGE